MITINDIPKNISLAEFINKCQIPGIGPVGSSKIAQEVKNIHTLRDMIEEGTVLEHLSKVNGLSSAAIVSLVDVLTDFDWMLLLEEMEEAGFDMFTISENVVYSTEELDEMRTKIVTYEDNLKNLPIDLKGQKICITGTLSLPRKMFQGMIEKNGGTFQSSVTNATDILIYSEKDGMSTVKYKMAQKINGSGGTISMITEKTFIDKFSKKV